MLSWNVSGQASIGVAMLIDTRQFATQSRSCRSWGARHGSARPPSSLAPARVRLLPDHSAAVTHDQNKPPTDDDQGVIITRLWG